MTEFNFIIREDAFYKAKMLIKDVEQMKELDLIQHWMMQRKVLGIECFWFNFSCDEENAEKTHCHVIDLTNQQLLNNIKYLCNSCTEDEYDYFTTTTETIGAVVKESFPDYVDVKSIYKRLYWKKLKPILEELKTKGEIKYEVLGTKENRVILVHKDYLTIFERILSNLRKSEWATNN